MSGARKLSPSAHVMSDVSKLGEGILDSHIVGIADHLEPDEVLRLACEQKLTHIVQRQGFQFDRELKSAESLIKDPAIYFKYPLATILSPAHLNFAEEIKYKKVDFLFSSSAKKREALDQITSALLSENVVRTAIDDVLSVADEMYTNAIFNAPFADMISLKNPGLSRHELEICLEDGKQCRLFLGMDPHHIVIGCEDPYGTLNLELYMKKIRNTYLKGPAATMNFGSGGAGIGSYIIFNAGSSLFLGVHPGQSTLLCCVIPKGISYRKRLQLPKNLHWIQL